MASLHGWGWIWDADVPWCRDVWASPVCHGVGGGLWVGEPLHSPVVEEPSPAGSRLSQSHPGSARTEVSVLHRCVRWSTPDAQVGFGEKSLQCVGEDGVQLERALPMPCGPRTRGCCCPVFKDSGEDIHLLLPAHRRCGAVFSYCNVLDSNRVICTAVLNQAAWYSSQIMWHFCIDMVTILLTNQEETSGELLKLIS